MSFNEYRLQQYVKKARESVSEKKDGRLRRKMRNIFYRLYPMQSLFNRNVADALAEILLYVKGDFDVEIKNSDNNFGFALFSRKQKEVYDSFEMQIEDLRTGLMRLKSENEDIKRENRRLREEMDLLKASIEESKQ
ncbi:hypothetical protein [Butyrivibrio sp. AE3004]|uniref:hypothetical protein n=1 Tax=Butyrivibrio sp. AE3004 TaxID=1506994 RepID=UPI000AD955ED|nr:hypothetical protein [Butyrivibrio sp. AE3004]